MVGTIGAVHNSKEARRRAKKRAEKERATKWEGLFKKADLDGTGNISRDEVAAFIEEQDGRTPDATELTFIMNVSDTNPPEGRLGVEEFAEAITAWQCYKEEFSKGSHLSVLFDECDVDKTGNLNQEQLQTLLGRYSHTTVGDDDAAAVLKQADAIGDGNGRIHRIELQLALALWFQRYAQTVHIDEPVEGEGEEGEKPKSKSCAIL